MIDLINKQQVIDAIHYEYDDCCNIDESGSAIADDIERIIDNVPSVQLNIICCKNCTYCGSDVVDVPYGLTKKIWWCDRMYEEANENLMVEPDDFCSWAERRQDG